MNAAAVKLSALPKSQLIELALRLGAERNAARAEADAAKAAARSWKAQAGKVHDYHFWTEQQVRDFAQAELDALAPDPHATQHLDDLINEIDAFASSRRPKSYERKRSNGPRCHKGHVGNFCGKPLDANGMCSRHDSRARKALRETTTEQETAA